VLAATLLGEAAVRSGLRAAGSSSYGSQARGGAASSDLIVSRRPIDYPHVSRPDVFVAMSQEACEDSLGAVAEGGVVLYDTFFVKPAEAPGIHQIPLGATEAVLEKLKAKQGANILFLGAVVELTAVVKDETVTGAIERNLDPRFRKNSMRAYSLGREMMAAAMRAAAGKP
jgi:2-oxoglutarate ferredoxin oxidoreductase subunit gamma